MSNALWFAARQGNLERVRELIDAGADINGVGLAQTPLMGAIFNGKHEVVDFLIENGANVNPEITDGTTPLVMAVFKNDARMVKRLIEAGANVNPDIGEGKSIFLYALTPRIPYALLNMEIVEALLKARVNLDKPIGGSKSAVEFIKTRLEFLRGNHYMQDGLLRQFERIATLPAILIRGLANRAWERRKAAVTAWAAARPHTYENENENQGGGRRRSRRRRNNRRTKKTYRRRH